MRKFKRILIDPGIVWRELVSDKLLKRSLGSCGENVSIGRNFTIAGEKNIKIGSGTAIGPNCVFYAAMAPLTIGDNVLISPNVTIVTGEHRTDVVGEYMRNIDETDKLPENDAPVVIEEDVWIGSNVVIMKGVTIGRGSIVHAGAVVTRSIKPYTMYISEKIKVSRFTEEEIVRHEDTIRAKYSNFQ